MSYPSNISLTTSKNNTAVFNWLMLGVAMTIVQIALGGITRLTGSGLSITQWDVVTGSLPPLNEGAWLQEFTKYQSTPQYRLLNSDFTLSNFKFIFFWEWFHRLWARLIGLVFAAGFAYFFLTKKFDKKMIWPLVLLFVLGGLQGAIGWIMVASGLVGDAIYVKPAKLALHFVFALGLLCYTFWFALKLKIPAVQKTANAPLRKFVTGILILLVIQLAFGALMAGHKAASLAPTWPTINGYFFQPPGSYQSEHGLLNFIDNKLLIHVVHRNLAYLISIIVLWFTVKLYKSNPGLLLRRFGLLPMLLVVIQVALGIGTVLTSNHIVPTQWGAFEWVAQLHQLTGMLLLLSLVLIVYLTGGAKKETYS